MFTSLEQLLQRKPVILQLLRFVCIGALNTALDFILLNFFTETFHVKAGVKLALLNSIGVLAAIVQSYYWNKYWAFAQGAATSLIRQFITLVFVGGLGLVAFIGAVLPSVTVWMSLSNNPLLPIIEATPVYFIILFAVFVLAQIVLWTNISYRVQGADQRSSAQTQFGSFVAVSIVGVIINSLVLTGLVAVLAHTNPDLASSLVKNLAKFIAVFVSLTWNFVGYKFFVFKQ